MAALKGLEFDAENQRVFILNDTGAVFIYTLAEKPPKLVKQIDTGSTATLRGLTIDYSRNYIFTCTTSRRAVGALDGVISVLETGKPGKDRFTKLIASMKGQDKSRSVCWRPSKLELIVAYESGQVAFWNIQEGQVARKSHLKE